MGHGEKIQLRRQLVGGMSPISVSERAELPAVYKPLESCLHFPERLLFGLGFQRRDHVHVVERGKVIKPEDVRMEDLGSLHHIAHQPPGFRRMYPRSLLEAE